MKASWSVEEDAFLLDQRGKRKLGWRAVHIEGATLRECQKRYAFLTSDQPKPVVRVATRGPDVAEDGMDRLVKKGKLTGARLIMARHYRTVGRLATAGGGAVKSCLDQSPGGGENVGLPGTGEAFEVTAAKREMLVMRFQVLKGQVDVLTALDGVLIGGQTLLYLAGGAGKGARAAELLLALYIGLDMLIAHANAFRTKAA